MVMILILLFVDLEKSDIQNCMYSTFFSWLKCPLKVSLCHMFLRSKILKNHNSLLRTIKWTPLEHKTEPVELGQSCWYSKTCVNRTLKNRQNKDLKDKW